MKIQIRFGGGIKGYLRGKKRFSWPFRVSALIIGRKFSRKLSEPTEQPNCRDHQVDVPLPLPSTAFSSIPVPRLPTQYPSYRSKISPSRSAIRALLPMPTSHPFTLTFYPPRTRLETFKDWFESSAKCTLGKSFHPTLCLSPQVKYPNDVIPVSRKGWPYPSFTPFSLLSKSFSRTYSCLKYKIAFRERSMCFRFIYRYTTVYSELKNSHRLEFHSSYPSFSVTRHRRGTEIPELFIKIRRLVLIQTRGR